MKKYKDLRVAVCGDVMLDYYVFSRPVRISNEAPVLVVKKSAVNYIPGGAGNVASNIASLGAKTMLGGVIGPDYFGSKLKHLLKEKGIRDALIIEKRPTTTKMRIICQNQQIVRLDTEIEASIRPEIAEKVLERFEEFKQEGLDGIVISDYKKGLITMELISRLKTFGVPIIINGKPDNLFLYNDIDVLVFNKYECDKALSKLQNIHVKDKKELREFLKLKALIVTDSSNGLSICTKGGSVDIAPEKITAVDSVGAGDTVISVFSLEYLMSKDFISAAKLANKAASISVTKFGTYTIRPDDI